MRDRDGIGGWLSIGHRAQHLCLRVPCCRSGYAASLQHEDNLNASCCENKQADGTAVVYMQM